MSTSEPRDLAAAVQELLGIDRSLQPSDRTVLSTLLLDPRPVSARELARATRTNLHALYTSLDRLEGRGLVVRTDGERNRTFRVAHPSVVLQELSDPWKRAETLALRVQEPLRDLYELSEVRLVSEPAGRAASTPSLPSCLSALVDRIRSASTGLWFLGCELPWLTPASAVEGQLLERVATPRSRLLVRLLVRRPPPASAQYRQLQRLRRAGFEVRFSDRWTSGLVLVDRSWVFLESLPVSGPYLGVRSYAWLEAPGLAADLVRRAEQEWGEAAAAGSKDLAPRDPIPAP